LSGDSLREATQGSTEFKSVFVEIKALDLALFADQMEALALVFESSSVIIHRFLHFLEAALEGKHALFGLLKSVSHLRGRYLGQRQALRPGGTTVQSRTTIKRS
jgi:hypothetical protein